MVRVLLPVNPSKGTAKRKDPGPSRLRDDLVRSRLRLLAVLLLVTRDVRTLCLPVLRGQLPDTLRERGERAELGGTGQVFSLLGAERQNLVLVLIPYTDVCANGVSLTR